MAPKWVGRRLAPAAALLLLAVGGGCGTPPDPPRRTAAAQPAAPKPLPDVSRRLAAYQPVQLQPDLASLDRGERVVLRHLVRAARHIDEIFWRQVSPDNIRLRDWLAQSADPASRHAYEFFQINYGCYDRMHQHTPFLGDAAKPRGANFYPTDMTRAEFEEWIAAHPADATAFRSRTTVIRRSGGGLEAVPYSREFRALLEPAAAELRLAAAAAANPSLRRFLELRADALLTDAYDASELAWLDLADTRIEPALGPYEVYEDRLFHAKAAFEAFVTVRLPGPTDQVAMYSRHLPELYRRLPAPRGARLPPWQRGAPIVVADAVETAGDARAGIQTSAFNLPLDGRIRSERGAKVVMLRNIMAAKFRHNIRPILERLLAADELRHVGFDAFFHFILFHELSHSLSPNQHALDAAWSVLGASGPPIEEAQADVLGVWGLLRLSDAGVVPLGRRELMTAYLANMLRSARFGTFSPHGQGNLIEFNYLRAHGAIRLDDATGRYGVDPARLPAAVEELARELIRLELALDRPAADAFVQRYMIIPPELQRALAGLLDIPADIRPEFAPVPPLD